MNRSLHMIGNAHIDAVWLWPWEEGFAEVKATFRSALDRMNEYPEFIFTCSSAAYYDWVERNEPAMFDEIRERVNEGRWRITGGWWVEPDCNIPSGESFVRQALIGQHYFASRFGRIARVGYNPDAFGHAGSLPQILAKAGLGAYTFLRPEPHERELPGNLFWWESADGSRVLAFRINFGYTMWGDLEEHIRRHMDRFVDGTDALMCFYGVGNHGGGPTKANIETIRALSDADDVATLRHSWPGAFFDAVADADGLPVIRDELQHHAVGCYAAVSGIKRWNREAEELLGFAERWAAIASRERLQPYPDELSAAWQPLLFNQYHDILAGTSIEPAYDDARSQIGESMAVADRALTNGVQAVSWAVDTRGPDGARPIVVANPHAWPSLRPVEVEVGRHAEGGRLVDDEGTEVPYQEVRPLATSKGRHRIVFFAELPSLGYRRYHLIAAGEGTAHETAAAVGEASATVAEGAVSEQVVTGHAPRPGTGSADAPTDVTAGDTWIESGRWRLEVDPDRGWIARLHDRRRGRDVFSGPAGRAVVAEDRSDTWSHGVTHFERGADAFEAERVRLLEAGPLRATIRAGTLRRSDGSRLIFEYTIHRDHDLIEVRTAVDWRGQYEILKLRFPVAVTEPVATWETSYGHIERDVDGAERPGQRWLDVSGASADGTRAGVSILNDGKYSSDVLGSEIGLTVLRSPIYAWHDPFVPEPDGVYPFTDQGVQVFRCAILPHDGDWRIADAARHAAELNMAPMVVLESAHDGPMPPSASFASCSAPGVALAVLKQAEIGEALVLRAHETWGQAADARIELPRWGIGFDASFGPSELKTFRIEPDGRVTETDLLEGLEVESR